MIGAFLTSISDFQSGVHWCPRCHALFSPFWRLPKRCSRCEELGCRECLTGSLCPDCVPLVAAETAAAAAARAKEEEEAATRAAVAQAEYFRLVEAAHRVRWWPASYRGRPPVHAPGSALRSQFWAGRKEQGALEELRMLAARGGYNALVDVQFESATASEPGSGMGTHYFTVFMATGVPCFLDDDAIRASRRPRGRERRDRD